MTSRNLYYEFGSNVLDGPKRLFCEAAVSVMNSAADPNVWCSANAPIAFVEDGRWICARMLTPVGDGVDVGSAAIRTALDTALYANGFYVTNLTSIAVVADYEKRLEYTISALCTVFVVGVLVLVWKLRPDATVHPNTSSSD